MSMDTRVAPRTVGWIAWVVLLAISGVDALSSSAFMSQIGSGYEFNPLVANVWENYGALGLLLYKIVMAGFFGLILVILATRESLTAIISLTALTLWAVLANLSISPTSNVIAVFLFSPPMFFGLTIAVGIVFWASLYPRFIERRRMPRL